MQFNANGQETLNNHIKQPILCQPSFLFSLV